MIYRKFWSLCLALLMLLSATSVFASVLEEALPDQEVPKLSEDRSI